VNYLQSPQWRSDQGNAGVIGDLVNDVKIDLRDATLWEGAEEVQLASGFNPNDVRNPFLGPPGGKEKDWETGKADWTWEFGLNRTSFETAIKETPSFSGRGSKLEDDSTVPSLSRDPGPLPEKNSEKNSGGPTGGGGGSNDNGGGGNNNNGGSNPSSADTSQEDLFIVRFEPGDGFGETQAPLMLQKRTRTVGDFAQGERDDEKAGFAVARYLEQCVVALVWLYGTLL
jgi:hypothetical protein